MGPRGRPYFSDAEGHRFLDMWCMGGTFSLGHRNPAVRAAADAAMREDEFGSLFFFSEAKGSARREVRAVHPRPLGNDASGGHRGRSDRLVHQAGTRLHLLVDVLGDTAADLAPESEGDWIEVFVDMDANGSITPNVDRIYTLLVAGSYDLRVQQYASPVPDIDFMRMEYTPFDIAFRPVDGGILRK